MKKKYFFLAALLITSNIMTQGISFEPHSVDNNFAGPGGIFVSDINNDNRSDILCAGLDANAIAWWENAEGEPITWSKQIIDNDFGGAIYVTAGDVDDDGYIDVLGAAFNDHELAWWHNDGGTPIQWTKNTIIESFTQAHEIMLIDLDMDEDMDVLGVSAGMNMISWFENDGNSPIGWTEHIITTGFNGARSVDAKDIDGDGDIDLAGAALLDHEIAWWRNDGGNPIEFTKITINTTFTYAHKVQIADMDNDGHMDILGTAYNAGLSWWRNDGADSIHWDKEYISSFSSAVIGLPIDADLDDDLDIICSAQTNNGKIGIWFNNNEFPIGWDYNLIESNLAESWPLHYGDLDNDGDLDIVCGGNAANEIRWYENDLIENETVSDFDENLYNTVTIGNQTWLKENLESLHYPDGTEITEVWAYGDNEANVETYGRLYTWDGAMNYSNMPGAQGVCPENWHIPTDAEWTELGAFLGGDNVAGGRLKETGTEHWQTPNAGATNESGFTALPSGEYDDTHYQFLNQYAVMWSSTETSETWCKYRYLSYEDAELHTYNYFKDFRYSVRCIKDAITGVGNKRNTEKKFIISPNPARETITIEISGYINFPLEIDFYDISGSRVKTTNIYSNKNQIDISSFPKGIYFITTSIAEGIIIGKLVKK